MISRWARALRVVLKDRAAPAITEVPSMAIGAFIKNSQCHRVERAVTPIAKASVLVNQLHQRAPDGVSWTTWVVLFP